MFRSSDVQSLEQQYKPQPQKPAYLWPQRFGIDTVSSIHLINACPMKARWVTLTALALAAEIASVAHSSDNHSSTLYGQSNLLLGENPSLFGVRSFKDWFQEPLLFACYVINDRHIADTSYLETQRKSEKEKTKANEFKTYFNLLFHV